MDAYVARQPIFNRKKALFAYELLFRDSLSNYFPLVDGDTATSQLLSSSFYTIGIDKITSGKSAFVNFTQNLLTSAVPHMFPREATVVEIVESVNPTPEILEACKKLASAGYRIALDDFVFKPELMPLIEMAHIVKVDFRVMTLDEIRNMMEKLGNNRIKFIAEKVETNAEFNSALDLGFDYFQGYFFSKPEIIQGKEISGSTMQLLRLMVEINKPDYDLRQIEDIISRDISISYKLLGYINSAFFQRRSDITSIRQALLILGKDELTRLISLITLSKIASNKPNELIKSSCVKAKFCERLGMMSDCCASHDELFMLGLFAHIDAILDQPMKEIMERLPVAKSIKDALVLGEGEIVRFLRLAEAYEKADWGNVKKYAEQCCVKESAMPAIYIEACEWSNELTA